jgi:TolB protein
MRNFLHKAVAAARSSLFVAALAAAILGVFAPPADAKIYIDIDAPSGRKVPIAIPEMAIKSVREDNVALARFAQQEIMDALTGDLDFSGYFELIGRDAYIDDPNAQGLVNFSNWRVIGAELLVTGSIRVIDEELIVELRLYDTVKEEQVVGMQLKGKANNPRRVAHTFADEIMRELTGKRGIFSTRVLFVASRSNSSEIYMSDYDGENVRQLTHNGSINISPQWSPDGSSMLYTSYKGGRPSLYMKNLMTLRESRVSDKPGINIAGRWSPDGRKAALTLSINNNPELYVLELDSLRYTRITENHGIDTSPAWSPDGSKLVYVSDVAGNPHIYMISSTGGEPKRLTFEGKYNAAPAWSPDGKWIAFARMKEGKFDIWIMRPNGTDAQQITRSGNNENPSWSPDSRHIIFANTDASYKTAIYTIRLDGTGMRKVPVGLGGEKAPAWSPYFE